MGLESKVVEDVQKESVPLIDREKVWFKTLKFWASLKNITGFFIF